MLNGTTTRSPVWSEATLDPVSRTTPVRRARSALPSPRFLPPSRSMKGTRGIAILKQAASEWVDDQAPSRAASLSYYTVFSIAPLLLIAVAIAGLVFGREAVSGELSQQLRGLVGDGGAEAIRDMMAS